MNNYIAFFSATAFIIYGTLCLFTNHMKAEFRRYGLSKFRLLTGALELIGGVGIIIGLVKLPIIFLISTGGLSLLMLLGIFARLKINDKFVSILPAIFFFSLNLYLFISFQF